MSARAPQQRAAWHAAYDAQMALWRWYRTAPGRRWMRGSYQNAIEKFAGNRGMIGLIDRLYDAEMGRLIDCDPLYVSEEMCEVADAARDTFKPEPLLETDLITPRGFLWWARGMEMMDKFGSPLLVRAASWSREYATHDDESGNQVLMELNQLSRYQELGDRIIPEEMEDFIKRGLIWPAGVSVTLYADRDHYLGVTQMRKRGSQAPDWAWQGTVSIPVVPFHITPWHFGQTFDGNEVDLNGDPTGAEDWWTMVQTTFRLMQQRIAVRHYERPSRGLRREARAAGASHEAEVVVVRLRREQGERHEPSGDEGNYSHRWIVGGHWRNQPYPSEGVTRQIWISPYVKGPEDKPLIVRPRRVYQWER